MKYGETLSGVPADAGHEQAGTPGRPLYRKEIVFATATVVTAIALSSAAIEIGLRLMDYPPTPKIGWKWDRSPYKSLANLSDTKVNQLGLRGRSIIDGKDKFVVVLVGDSYLEAGAQPFEDMPEQIFERELIERWGVLNARVSTVAAAGWSQDQQLLALESYFHRFRADLVLMWLTPFNDYWENTFVDRSVGPIAGPLKPTFRPRGLDAVEPVVLPTSSLKLFELI